jgi:tetratricopeptide (TPR) repeat protein
MRRVTILGSLLLIAIALPGQSSQVLVRQVQQDIAAGRYPQAEAELARAAAQEPDNWKLWNNLGVLRVQLGRNESAIAAFEKARRAAPQQAPPCFGLGVVYMKQGDFPKALDVYRTGLALDPSDLVANQNYVFLLTHKGDFRAAIEPLNNLKKLQPGNMPTRATLIEAYLKAGMQAQGEEEVRQFLSSPAASMHDDISLAKLLIADRQIPVAVEVLRHAVAAWPDAAEPHGDLGLLLTQTGNYEAAVAELGRASQLDPESAEYGLGLGEALLRWRHDPVALQYLLAVRDKFGNHPLYQFELGLAYFYLTKFPLALQQFEALAQKQPQSSRVQYLLGGSWQAMGNLNKAEQCYRKAIALKPDEPSYYLTLATLLKKENPSDLSVPVQLSEKALALNPANDDVKLLLASCYATQGKLDHAETLLQAVIRHDADSRAAHIALAQVYLREKRLDDAKQQETLAARLEERQQSQVSPWGPGGVEHP